MRITFLSSRRELKSFSSAGTQTAENSCARSRSSSRESWGLRTVKATLQMGPSRNRHTLSSVLVFRFKWWELYLISRIHKSSTPGVHKFQMPKQQVTELWTKALNIFSAVFFLYIQKASISSHAPSRKHQIRVRFTGHSSTVGGQYGNYFMSPFRHQQSGGGAQIFVKFVYSRPRLKYVFLITIKSFSVTTEYKKRYRIMSLKQN